MAISQDIRLMKDNTMVIPKDKDVLVRISCGDKFLHIGMSLIVDKSMNRFFHFVN